jgi:hypothetical protein
MAHSFFVRCPRERENREAGEIPGRAQRCEADDCCGKELYLFSITCHWLLNREGSDDQMKPSQKTGLTR